ncbi:restriction endonuclease subunit S [Rheinheimera sp.]|uniref:restriction endonuclease subunit S n=1 Tax=Rheinheimera sp. TaxID=1869214 RepID=UPI004047C00C
MAEVNLPGGWAVTTLENVAAWGSGGTPSRKESAYYDGNVPWVKTGDLGPRVLYNSSEFISELAVQNSSAKYFPKGSVAIAMYGATIGKTSILGIDATTNQACGVGNPIEGITFSEFLYYFLLNEKDNFIAKGKGGAQPNISQALIKEHEIALPPLAEQKVIAEKLDTLLAQVDNTKARLERIPEILKRFRQSVLAAAVSGKLTEEWREQSGLSWPTEHSNLGDLLELLYGKSLPAATRSGEGYPVYGSNGQVGRHNEYLVEGPFIIVGRKGSYGEVNWSEENGWPIDTTYYVDLKQNANLKFVFFLLQTLGLNQLNRSTAIPGLNREDAYEQTIEIPKISEQTEIVRRVEELFAFADRIEHASKAALNRVNNLTQSILAKAFRGELTLEWRAANPELISGEHSAEALLARIKAERAALGAKPKKSKG